MKKTFILLSLVIMTTTVIKAQISETEPNNSFNSANPITLGTTVSGQNCWFDDPDYFRIILPTDGRLRIYARATANVQNPFNGLSLTLISKTDFSWNSFTLTATSGGGLLDSIDYCCLAADTFYIKSVNSWIGSVVCVDYSFTCKLIPSTFTNDAEPNDISIITAPLAYNTSAEGHLAFVNKPSYNTDVVDNYTIVTPSDGVLRVITQTESQIGANRMAVILLDKSSHVMSSLNSTAGSFQNPHTDTLYYSCITQDTMILKLYTYNAFDGGYAYKFRYDVISPVFENDKEPNNSYATALKVDVKTDIEGHNCFYGKSDYDYFKFYKPEVGSMKIYIQAEAYGPFTNNKCTVRLQGYNHSDYMVKQPLIGGNSVPIADSMVFATLPADTFYVAVQIPYYPAPCMSYKIKIQLPESTTGISETDKINFSIYPNPSNGNFKLNLDSKMLNPIIRVYNVYGQNVYTEILKGTQTKELNLADHSPGVYLIYVSDGNYHQMKRIIIK